MAADFNLTNQYISASFQNLMQISGSIPVNGTGSAISNLTVTASNAVSASHAPSSVSASYALSSSHSEQADNATSSSYAANATSSSYAITSSHAIQADSSSTAVSASHAIQADSALTATSASHAVNSDSSISASHALNSDNSISSSFASTATSASHALNADLALDANDLIVGVKNTLGVTISKGSTLHATGVTGENIDVITASCDSDMPAIGLALDNINAGAAGNAIVSGKLVGTDTSGFVAGNNVYVGLNGALTATKPTGSHLIQNIGIVGKVDAADGELVVLGAGRSNDVPNITQGYLWVGNGDGVATPVTSESLWTGKDISVNSITASGASFTSASIGYLRTITGSATIIGDEYIILNADSPTKRFAGIKVYDSGSGLTGSFEWDSVDDNWIQVETGGESAGMLTGPSGSKGSEVYPTANTILKGTGNHTVQDSIITDNGTTVTVAGIVSASAFLGDGSGLSNITPATASYAVTASHALNADDAISSSYALSASHAEIADNLSAGDKNHSGTINKQINAPGSFAQKNFVTVSNVTFNGTSYPISEFVYMDYGAFGDAFANAYGINQWDGFSYTAGAELLIAPQRVQFNLTPQGLGPTYTGVMAMQSGSTGTGSQVLCYASEVQLGSYRGVTIELGNRSGVATRQTENLNINAVTSSMTTDYNYNTANVGHFSTGGERGNVTAITNGGGGGSTLSLNGGNFFTLDLNTNSTTLNLNTGDIYSSYGQTFSILVDNSTSTNTLSFGPNFKFAGGSAPTITTNGTDLLRGITFGTNDAYITAVQNLS